MRKRGAERFAVVILTHGRAENVVTLHTLRRSGYTGDIFLLCDDEDEQLALYRSRYGDAVWTFHKADYEDRFDHMDNFGRSDCVVFARNAVYDVAREHGVRYLAVLDDDYPVFMYRIAPGCAYECRSAKNLDAVFATFLAFLRAAPVKTVCFAQGGDFIGGAANIGATVKRIPRRKAMNLFFLDSENPLAFHGTLNEDLTASLLAAAAGDVLLTVPLISLDQRDTQSAPGGLTDLYVDLGTYVKSFYSVLAAPSAVRVSVMSSRFARIHHRVNWGAIAPKILREEYAAATPMRRKKRCKPATAEA